MCKENLLGAIFLHLPKINVCRPVGASPGWIPKSITFNRQNCLVINGKSKAKPFFFWLGADD